MNAKPKFLMAKVVLAITFFLAGVVLSQIVLSIKHSREIERYRQEAQDIVRLELQNATIILDWERAKSLSDTIRDFLEYHEDNPNRGKLKIRLRAYGHARKAE